MFEFGKKGMNAQVNDAKETINQCIDLKEEVASLLDEKHRLSNEEELKIEHTLISYSELHKEILAVKKSDLSRNEKLKLLINKKGSITQVKSDLEKAKQILEETKCV